MNILAIDTSTDYLSAAVMDGDEALSRFHRRIGRNHSRLLIPTIDKLLKSSKVKLKEIDGFCVGIGPGSFTGLRIGVATIKGLAYSLQKPIVAIPTLDVIADNAMGFIGVICPVLDARKNKIYASIYKSDGKAVKRISGYLLLSVQDFISKVKKYGRVYFLGDAVSLLGVQEKGGVDWHPKADLLARRALDCFKKESVINPEDLEPLYLYSRECDITGY